MSTERPLKCVRCSLPAIYDEYVVITPRGDVFHQRCWDTQEVANEPRITRKFSQQLEDFLRKNEVRRREPGTSGQRPDDDTDPICPVCLQAIKASDMVVGLRDDLMHQRCDYANQPKPPRRWKPPDSESHA